LSACSEEDAVKLDYHHDIIRRIRGEFLEMPGLSLTIKQAQRLWGLDPQFCHALLNALVDAGFLARTHEGAFVHHDASSPL
jgi:hypothetical protein